GLATLVAAELSGSILAGAGASLLLAGSYTFWSQSIIAEGYALHMLAGAGALLLLLRGGRQPTLAGLAAVLFAYRLRFGNRLSMILLLPGYAVFLLIAAPGGWRSMLRPRVVALALVVAIAGSLQYAWNFRGLWRWPDQPAGLADAFQTFWFDVTKADWRET